MQKETAVASLGESALLMPAWARAALAANDRLKFYLSTLQAAVSHANNPEIPVMDLRREQEAAGVRASWLQDLITGSARDGRGYSLPGLPYLLKVLRADLDLMARPVLQTPGHDTLAERYRAEISLQKNDLVAELASNDGCILKPFKAHCRIHGVEPVKSWATPIWITCNAVIGVIGMPTACTCW